MKSDVAKRIESINNGIIPEGYKKTKVGIVPVEWETVKLKTISKHSTEKNKDLKYHETYTNSATQGIIKQTDYFDKQISNNENIDGYYVVKHNDYVYNPRISVSAPCGPIRKSHFSETGVMSPLYTIFRLNDEYEDNEYIEHYFNSPFWHRYMSSVANYGARHDRMNITNDDLFNMPIPFPPLPEQQKIAEILSTQDKLIELQERKINQLKTLKKGYLQKMFPKKGCKYPELRFKGFTNPWEQREVKELCSISTGKSNTQDKIDEGEYPFYVRSPIVERSNKYLYDEEAVLTVGDGVGTGKVFHYVNGKYDLHQRCYRMYAFSDELNAKYFYHTFSHLFYKRVMAMTAKTSVDSVRLEMISDMEIPTPTIAEQEKVGAFFTNLDHLITLHQRKLDEEKQKKKALMQLLLTGKVRVK